jgi:phospholipase/carboxylesterase
MKENIIGGFSQGAIMSYKLALLYPNKFEGIFIHSARLPVEYSVKESFNLYKNLNILIIHGSEDSGLSTKWAYQGKALFKN